MTCVGLIDDSLQDYVYCKIYEGLIDKLCSICGWPMQDVWSVDEWLLQDLWSSMIWEKELQTKGKGNKRTETMEN